ncbi:MAG: hypothetical protein ACREV7_17000 [Steroidobacteraceae bacterium]
MSREIPAVAAPREREAASPDIHLPRAAGILHRAHPLAYLAIVIAGALLAVVYQIRANGIFACPATGYSADRYLAYCGATHYGDYEHGAFWFGLEPTIAKFASRAPALFLGNSRTQVAFSTRSTADWFSTAASSYYLLGFSYDETDVFEGRLLERFKPRARVYIINVDRFFSRSESIPARYVMHDTNAEQHYRHKRLWQVAHRTVCSVAPIICGARYAVFRSRDTGAWSLAGGVNDQEPVSYDSTIDPALVARQAAIASEFLARLPVRSDCVLLTVVPAPGIHRAEAAVLAARLGMHFVSPKVGRLYTYDGSHLDRESAERWAAAFFRLAGPRIRGCLGGPQSLSSENH